MHVLGYVILEHAIMEKYHGILVPKLNLGGNAKIMIYVIYENLKP